MKCVTCEKGEMTKKKVEYNYLEQSLGWFDALVCPKCNEIIFEGSVSLKIEEKAKALGLWGLARKSKVGTSGTSLDIKLPKQIAEFLGIKKGQEIIIEPRTKNKIEITMV